MPSAAPLHRSRTTALLAGVAQWRDPHSDVRASARLAFRDGEWPPEVVEVALDRALYQADEVIEKFADAAQPVPGGSGRSFESANRAPVLAILPGNVVGPALATAYSAAAAGASLMLKSSSRELHLAGILAAQFEGLGPALAGALTPMRWSGGDADFEAKVFARASKIVVFGDDATIADIKRRAPVALEVIGYGSAFSIGYVPAAVAADVAAAGAAADVALFDQRGCLSPQTIYVDGDEGKALLFAQALRGALERIAHELPRARAGEAEKAAVAQFVRRLLVRALPCTHALDTVMTGKAAGGIPSYVIGVEAYSAPACAGFGRIVIVKPCAGPEAAARAAGSLEQHLDTIGVAGGSTPGLDAIFASCGASRVCALGDMQRPPFGYRPRIGDFLVKAHR